MKNFSDGQRCAGEGLFSPFLSEVTDPDDPFGLENFHHAPQMAVTRGKERFRLRCGQLVRRQVAPVFVEERQGTVVDDEVIGKKIPGRAKALSEQAPQSFAADLGTRTGKTRD